MIFLVSPRSNINNAVEGPVGSQPTSDARLSCRPVTASGQSAESLTGGCYYLAAFITTVHSFPFGCLANTTGLGEIHLRWQVVRRRQVMLRSVRRS